MFKRKKEQKPNFSERVLESSKWGPFTKLQEPNFDDLSSDVFPDTRALPSLTRIKHHKHRMRFIGVDHEEAYFGDPVIADDRFGWICADYECAYQIYIMRWKWEQMLRGFW